VGNRLREISWVFLKLGLISFGGPVAHIAIMRSEFVEKRKWMDDGHFLDLIGATNLIPGPNSTEMAIHIGRERAGLPGLLVAGLSFILPAIIITGFFAWLYKTYGQLPEVQPFLFGIKPAIIAIVVGAVYPLGKKALKSIQLSALGLLAFVLCLFGFNEIYVMFGMGFLAVLTRFYQDKYSFTILPAISFFQQSGIGITNVSLFLSFLKIGTILYGSGYVLFAFLDAELVSAGLITHQQLIDAIAIGQITPGPVFSSVTFIGWQINDFSGALVATMGVFLPSFVYVAVMNPLVAIMRRSKRFSMFLDGVNVASVAIIISVCVEMGRSSIADWRAAAIGIPSLVVTLLFRRVNSAIIIVGGAALGYLLMQL